MRVNQLLIRLNGALEGKLIGSPFLLKRCVAVALPRVNFGTEPIRCCAVAGDQHGDGNERQRKGTQNSCESKTKPRTKHWHFSSDTTATSPAACAAGDPQKVFVMELPRTGATGAWSAAADAASSCAGNESTAYELLGRDSSSTNFGGALTKYSPKIRPGTPDHSSSEARLPGQRGVTQATRFQRGLWKRCTETVLKGNIRLEKMSRGKFAWEKVWDLLPLRRFQIETPATFLRFFHSLEID